MNLRSSRNLDLKLHDSIVGRVYLHSHGSVDRTGVLLF